MQLGFSPDIGAELLRAHLENKLGRGVGLLLSTADTHPLKSPLNAKMLAICIIRSSGQRMNHVKLESLLMRLLYLLGMSVLATGNNA